MAFNYTSRDYDTIKSDMFARAATVFPEWTDRDPSDFGVQLVELWAYAADSLHYYIDRGAAEAFLPTAQQRESVLAHANLFDYIPGGRSSAAGTITLANSTTSSIQIPAYTRFVFRHNETSYQVYTSTLTDVPGESSVAVPVKEGEIFESQTLTAAASGDPNQTYTINREGIAPTSIVVTVQETENSSVLYQRISRIINAAQGDRVFVSNTASDGTTTISFGSTVNGFIPPAGSTINITYAVSSGVSGNLPAVGTEYISWYGAAIPGIGINGATALSGGADEESITSMKTSIPTTISSQNRAVTKRDFVALTTQVQGVEKAAVEYTAPPTGQNGSVTIYPQVVRSDFLDTFGNGEFSQTVDADTQASVLSNVVPRSLLGVDVDVASTITWDSVDITATVNVNERFVAQWVKNSVEENIDLLFSFENVLFGQRLHLGQVYQLILAAPGVDYANVTVFDNDGAALETDILIDEFQLPQKGNITITTSGGITTT